MMADFQCVGKTEVFRDRLNKCDRGAAKNAAHRRRYQKGRSSEPVAVGFRLFNNLNTVHSDTYSVSSELTECLTYGDS